MLLWGINSLNAEHLFIKACHYMVAITECFGIQTQGWPLFTFTFMHLAYAFIQGDLQFRLYNIHFFICTFVSWGLNPQPFALLVQCSTTEPQKHLLFKDDTQLIIAEVKAFRKKNMYKKLF